MAEKHDKKNSFREKGTSENTNSSQANSNENALRVAEVKPKSKIVYIVLLVISSLITISFAVNLIVGLHQKNNYVSSISESLYLQSSKTVFNNDNTITVYIKNVSNKTFEDKIVHLIYKDIASGITQGTSYSEQKIVTFNKKEEVEITFENPWQYSEYCEIYACIFKGNSTWIQLENGRSFNPSESKESDYLILASLIALPIAAISDVILAILIIKKRKKEAL